MKLIAETTGPFQLYAYSPEQFVQAHRPSVVRSTAFINQHMAAKRCLVLAQVNDEATDEEFARYLAEAQGDKDLAIQSFVSAFPVDAKAEAEVEAPKKGRRK